MHHEFIYCEFCGDYHETWVRTVTAKGLQRAKRTDLRRQLSHEVHPFPEHASENAKFGRRQ